MTIFDKPVFAIPDPQQAEKDLQDKYSELTGKELFPAQPETLLSNWAAYLKTVVDANIQFTGEQSLVNFATGVNLDQLGVFWDAPRLEPQKALTTIEFTLTATKGFDYVIPSGTRIRTQDKKFIFATVENTVIPTGELSVQVEAQCTVEGKDANNYPIGKIDQLFDLLSDISSATNISASSSGSDFETDDRYRERLKLAPNRLSTAGSRDSYKFWALTADSSITDVSVKSLTEEERLARQTELALECANLIKDVLLSEFGIDTANLEEDVLAPYVIPYVKIPRYYVEIYPLTANGLPSEEILNKVRDILSSNTVRPLTDEVLIVAPTQINVDISADIIAYNNANIPELMAKLEQILEDYSTEVSLQLGRNIIPSQIIERLQIPGVYQVLLNEPLDRVLVAYNQRPFIVNKTITLVGLTDELSY